MNNLINNIVSNFHNFFSDEIIVLIISMCPLLELRGGLVAAALLKMPYIKASIIAILGNVIPIPFILLFFKHIINLLDKYKITKPLANFLQKKAIKNKPKIDKYGFWGLTLFVGIPLPGTGAFTGSLIASLFNMPLKKASISILLGIILAFIIMSLLSYGLIIHLV